MAVVFPARLLVRREKPGSEELAPDPGCERDGALRLSHGVLLPSESASEVTTSLAVLGKCSDQPNCSSAVHAECSMRTFLHPWHSSSLPSVPTSLTLRLSGGASLVNALNASGPG